MYACEIEPKQLIEILISCEAVVLRFKEAFSLFGLVIL